MLSRQPKQNLLFESAVADLIRCGAELKPHDYVWLYDTAKRANCDECPAYIEIPVQIGNATLYPMTIGAMLWWRDCGAVWYEDGKEAHVMALAWAMAHSKDQQALTEARSKSRFNGQLVAWQIGLSCSCTIAQLAWGIEKVIGQYDVVEINTPNERKVDAASGADWGDIIARLCASYHQTPDFFLWQISERAALELLAKAPRPFDGLSGGDSVKSQALGELFELKRYLAQNRKAS